MPCALIQPNQESPQTTVLWLIVVSGVLLVFWTIHAGGLGGRPARVPYT